LLFIVAVPSFVVAAIHHHHSTQLLIVHHFVALCHATFLHEKIKQQSAWAWCKWQTKIAISLCNLLQAQAGKKRTYFL